MFNLKCTVLGSDPAGSDCFTAYVSAHSILYSERREAMLIACSDMGVLLKRMSSEFYDDCMSRREDELAQRGLVNMADLGGFMRASSMSDVDTTISSQYDIFCRTASNWDSISTPAPRSRGGESAGKGPGLQRLSFKYE